MTDTTPSGAGSRRDSLIDSYQRERAAVAEQRKELALLIKQAVAEVDRLSQRNRELSSQMRQVQANIEAFSREEIQQRFASYQEAQMRLFMMQSQLEQLRSRQTNLERTEQLLGGFLDAIASWGSDGEEGAPAVREADSAQEGTMAAVSAADVLPSMEMVYHRLSRELQDGPEQALSDIILRAEVCERLARVDIVKAREELAGLKRAAAAALSATRRLVHELHPPSLGEMGLAAAVRRLVELWHSSGGLEVELRVEGQERRLPRDLELGVFRIIQEGLLNAARHSGVDRATVTLRFEEHRLVASVSDQGQGFDVHAALSRPSVMSRSGLADMRLRAELLGADLEITSRPSGGCTITVSVSSH